MTAQIQNQKMLSKYSYTDIHSQHAAIYTVSILKRNEFTQF